MVFVEPLTILLLGLNVILFFMTKLDVLIYPAVMLKGLKWWCCQTSCVTTFKALKHSNSLKNGYKTPIFLPSRFISHKYVMYVNLLYWIKQRFCNISTAKPRQVWKTAWDFTLVHISPSNLIDEFQMKNIFYWWWCRREEEQNPSLIWTVGSYKN